MLDVRFSGRKLPLVMFLLVDDARYSDEELPDLNAEAFVAFAILLDRL
jgi:hypothetical protein